MNAEGNKKIIRDWVEQGWNGGATWIAEDIFAADFVATDHATGRTIRGPSGMAAFVKQWRERNPEIHFEIDALIAEGNMVAGFFTVTGVLVSGGQISDVETILQAADVWRFNRDGKVVERVRAVVQNKP